MTATVNSSDRGPADRSTRAGQPLGPRRETRREIPAEPITTCKAEVALIGDYLTSRLRSRGLKAFEKHLEDCSDCASFLHTYKKTVEMTRAFLQQAPLTKKPKFEFRPRQGQRHNA
jgi:hypothetical protein